MAVMLWLDHNFADDEALWVPVRLLWTDECSALVPYLVMMVKNEHLN
jgi:hypothetical protein